MRLAPKISMVSVVCMAMMASTAAFAGAANADLSCRSSDGVTVSGNVPGDFAEFDMTVQQGSKSARLFSVTNQSSGQTEENATISTVQDLRNGVWTLVSNRMVPGAYGYVQLYALPKTMKFQTVPNGYNASFTAKLRFNLKDIADSSVDKTVSCTLEYGI